jgi:hypothetical protein
VFNTRGELCGVISSNMPPSAPDEEHISYVTLLWPLLGVTLDIPRDGHPRGRYPVLELGPGQHDRRKALGTRVSASR